MDYLPPSGATDPNAPFLGKNAAAGIQGSKVPRGAIENPMREIVAAIRAANLAPTNADLTQLAQAIKVLAGQVAPSRSLIHYGAATGPANAYTVTSLSPALTAIEPGTLIEILFATPNTGPSTLTLATFDPARTVSLVRGDGSSLKGNDIVPSSSLFSVRPDGSLALVNYNPAVLAARSSELFIAPGTSLWIPPQGVYSAFVEVWAAGGAGGGAANASSAGCGGGPGGFASGWVSVTPGLGIPYTNGKGGTSGAAGGGDGTGGGSSSFGSSIGATGGDGGKGSTSGIVTVASAAGIGFGGAFRWQGVVGQFGYAAGTAFFGGTNGAGYGASINPPGSNSPGAPGAGAGSGGSGASNNATGGAGADGQIRISY